jgi:hypothetical protein
VFKPRIINSVHASTVVSTGKVGRTLSLATNVKDATKSEGDATEPTPVNVIVTPRKTRPSSERLAVRKR